MKLIFTPHLIELILRRISNATKKVEIIMGVNSFGAYLNKLVRVLILLLEDDDNIEVSFLLEKKKYMSIYFYLRLKLGKFRNFKLRSRSKINEIDNVRFVNIDDTYFFVGSIYFSDNIYRCSNVTLLLDKNVLIDKNYIDELDSLRNKDNDLIFISEPHAYYINDDINGFIKRAKKKLVLILPVILTQFGDLEVLRTLKKLSNGLNIFLILSGNNRLSIKMNDSLEVLFGKYKNTSFKFLYTKVHFDYKFIIRDDTDVLMSTGNIERLNYKNYDINIKLYDNEVFVKKIYENIETIIKPKYMKQYKEGVFKTLV